MPNRLATESSPYLKQHAANPVDWYPWGEDAFAEARATDRPILLSVGYAACHWCHVMAHESFEDPATAAVMNELFVNVKVDREERPDVDNIYMQAVQAMTGRGGWPMTVFLTPDGEPHAGYLAMCHRVAQRRLRKEHRDENQQRHDCRENQITCTHRSQPMPQRQSAPRHRALGAMASGLSDVQRRVDLRCSFGH